MIHLPFHSTAASLFRCCSLSGIFRNLFGSHLGMSPEIIPGKFQTRKRIITGKLVQKIPCLNVMARDFFKYILFIWWRSSIHYATKPQKLWGFEDE
jgi:hypothetical protein